MKQRKDSWVYDYTARTVGVGTSGVGKWCVNSFLWHPPRPFWDFRKSVESDWENKQTRNCVLYD